MPNVHLFRVVFANLPFHFMYHIFAVVTQFILSEDIFCALPFAPTNHLIWYIYIYIYFSWAYDCWYYMFTVFHGPQYHVWTWSGYLCAHVPSSSEYVVYTAASCKMFH